MRALSEKRWTVRITALEVTAGRILRSCRFLLILTMGIACAHAQNPNALPASGASSRMAREMLTSHNAVREKLKIPPLQWSDRLAAVAQQWANTLLRKHQFTHNADLPYGENLFDIAGAVATPATAVKFWVSESRNYDYATNTCRGLCGHYTQIVWRDTRYVGCAVARGGGREVWVCEYDPPGNVLGQRPY